MEPTFLQRLNGYFEGILRWGELTDFWLRIRSGGNEWYFYQVGTDVPLQPMDKEELDTALCALDALLRREHDHDYCGVVYADSPQNPGLVKVYDPNNLGTSCGCSGARILPRWIISRYPPQEIVDEAPAPNTRRRWWRQLFRTK